MAFDNCCDDFSLQWTGAKSAKLTRISAMAMGNRPKRFLTEDAMQIVFQVRLSLRQSSPTSHLVACQRRVSMKVVMWIW
jgi:hypothetical protein